MGGIGVLRYVQDSFESKTIKQDFEQNKHEMNQAYIKNDKSIFFGSWSCKKCKTKKKHSLIKEKKERMAIPLSVKRWICGICGNRNAMEFKQCYNCGEDKMVFQGKCQSPKRHKTNTNQ